jgi:polyisoprenyl-phosphate glycosyltransferase
MPDIRPTLALVLPCYNEEENIPFSVAKLTSLYDYYIRSKLIDAASFILFVDDGSKDHTFCALQRAKNKYVRIVKLSTNKGHQYALLAGLQYTAGKADCVISIDADLQDDLTVIEKMIHRYMQGAHIVCGVRSNRQTDGWFKRKTARVFYWFMNKMGVPLIEDHADFRLLSNQALMEVMRYKEVHIFLRGLLPLINLRLETISYQVNERQHGKTKYTVYKMISLAIRAVTSYSSAPIRIITLIGFLLFVVTMILSVNVLIAYFRGDVVPGWASITLPLYFLGGIQLVSLGIIGEYIAKTYMETKRRPPYHIEQILE